MSTLSLSLTLLIISLVSAAGFDYTDCGSIFGKFSKIVISECDPPNAAFCSLKRGTNATLTTHFIPSEKLTLIPLDYLGNTDRNVTSVKAVVHGILGVVPVPFNLPNPNGCVDSNLTCPLQSGTEYTYVATLPVLEEYPRVRVTVKWELQDQETKDIICFKLPAKIV